MSENPDDDPIIVKIYADKDRRQYKVTIPKKVVQVLKYKHGDEFILDYVKGTDDILLKKVEK